MRFLVLVGLLVCSSSALAQDVKIYRRADGAACAVFVSSGALQESCEAAVVPPRPEATRPAPTLVPAAAQGPARQDFVPSIDVARLASGSVKHAWGAALALTAAANGLVGLLQALDTSLANDTAASVNLVFAGVAGLGGAVLLFLGSSDFEKAKESKEARK